MVLLVLADTAYAQRPVNEIETTKHLADTSKQRDLIDIGKEILHIKPPKQSIVQERKSIFPFYPFRQMFLEAGTLLQVQPQGFI
jgi:hypothetical protein